MNPWHDVNLGDELPVSTNCIIEVPAGSKYKYELDKESGLIKVDRVLYGCVHYPANYGFMPQTYCLDNDPLDILVLGQGPILPRSIVKARPIASMKMIDEGDEDDKVIAIHADDPEYAGIKDISDLPPHKIKEIQKFFEDYKDLEGKDVIVDGFVGIDLTYEIINKAIAMYKDVFPSPSNSLRAIS